MQRIQAVNEYLSQYYIIVRLKQKSVYETTISYFYKITWYVGSILQA